MIDALNNIPKVILYCGTFDPPHRGHVDCAVEAAKMFPQTEIWVLPSPTPAQANRAFKKPTCEMDQRCEMCRLAFNGDGALKNVKVLGYEAELPAPNYTINLLRWLKTSEKLLVRPSLLMGLDQLTSFAGWVEPSEILRHSDLIVVRRSSLDVVKAINEVIAVELGMSLKWVDENKRALLPDIGAIIHILDIQTADVSSSEIRHSLSGVIEMPIIGLTPLVQEYVEKNKLYSIINS